MNCIGIVESEPVFRYGLSRVLEDEPGVMISLQTASADVVIECCSETALHTLFISTDLPTGNGLCLVHRLAQCGHYPTVILYSTWRSPSSLTEASRMNISALLHRHDDPEEFCSALRLCVNGDQYWSGRVLSLLENHEGSDDHHVLLRRLTRTELMILRCIGEYQTSRQIAERMSISTHTVKKHRVNMARKLNISGFHALIGFALELRKDHRASQQIADER